MDDISTAQVVVIGRVQGVFFRQTTKKKAQSLGLVGWVRNQPDGSVQLQATGPKGVVMQLIEWCRKGPATARVDELQIVWLEAPQLSGQFEIVR